MQHIILHLDNITVLKINWMDVFLERRVDVTSLEEIQVKTEKTKSMIEKKNRTKEIQHGALLSMKGNEKTYLRK